MIERCEDAGIGGGRRGWRNNEMGERRNLSYGGMVTYIVLSAALPCNQLKSVEVHIRRRSGWIGGMVSLLLVILLIYKLILSRTSASIFNAQKSK